MLTFQGTACLYEHKELGRYFQICISAPLTLSFELNQNIKRKI